MDSVLITYNGCCVIKPNQIIVILSSGQCVLWSPETTIFALGRLVVLVLWHINLCRLINVQSILKQIISSISNNSVQYKYSLIVKIFLFQAIQLIQTVLIQLIQFSVSIYFVYTQLNVKRVLY